MPISSGRSTQHISSMKSISRYGSRNMSRGQMEKTHVDKAQCHKFFDPSRASTIREEKARKSSKKKKPKSRYPTARVEKTIDSEVE